MKMRIACGLLALLLGVSIGLAGLVAPQPPRTKQELAGFRSRSYVETAKANERVLVMVSGSGQSCLAVYVFDAQGNCVAMDDKGSAQTADDLLTEWVPTEETRYSVEVRNAGSMTNDFSLAMR